jgi:hypothetical protein
MLKIFYEAAVPLEEIRITNFGIFDLYKIQLPEKPRV